MIETLSTIADHVSREMQWTDGRLPIVEMEIRQGRMFCLMCRAV